MYVGLLCNVNPTSTFTPCNAYHILTELSMWFECVEIGKNRFGDLEPHGWTPLRATLPYLEHLNVFTPRIDAQQIMYGTL